MITVKKELDDIDKKILFHYSKGKTNKEIASIENMSIWTVINKVQAMKKYFKCKSIPELIATLKK